MALNFFEASVAGNVTRDPRIGNAGSRRVANLSLAVNNPFKREDPPIYLDVEVWSERQVDFIEKYIKTGNNVVVTGSVTQREWTDNKGITRKSFVLRANQVLSNAPKARAEEAEEDSELALDDLP